MNSQRDTAESIVVPGLGLQTLTQAMTSFVKAGPSSRVNVMTTASVGTSPDDLLNAQYSWSGIRSRRDGVRMFSAFIAQDDPISHSG
ncbi:uncharacterized protein ColSpa_00753 [Colletotrichum spaethianum]|uniref:Uncharacterized protein n=1 Tax=Colletotrichum spaethianum TaxID=700344 RepID=A0AA37LA59_9PEZI|nr:uncharacterized protein ColSpa_00753 [Colletotrichum spaethianum]GKT40572.1 hypothetical protein ColSpa_00753 [Colletotrichum spaethianum]